MPKKLLAIACLFLVGCATKTEPVPDGSVRLRFVPGSPPANPANTPGTSFSALHLKNFTDENTYGLFANAIIGGPFPVKYQDGPVLFSVVMTEGDDDRITLKINADSGEQLITIDRDVPEYADVDGARYRFRYPSVSVATSANQTTTNSAHIFISTPKIE